MLRLRSFRYFEVRYNKVENNFLIEESQVSVRFIAVFIILSIRFYSGFEIFSKLNVLIYTAVRFLNRGQVQEA